MKTLIIFFIIIIFFISGCTETINVEKEETKPIIETKEEIISEDLVEDSEIIDLPEHCTDGMYNNGEEGLDCGWTCPNKCEFIEKYDIITKDETWSGNILVSSYTEIPEGVTVTIKPGTILKFQHGRDYKYLHKASLNINGGTVKAIGTKDKPIWFTSWAPNPINGDWWGISLNNAYDSKFDYVIVEFGEMGIEQFDSKISITNSIIRWSNAEGFYAERSEPSFINNTLYGNGYHEIALEQYNNVIIKNNIIRDGHYGIHHEKTESLIEDNCIFNEHVGISAGMESSIIVRNNNFKNIGPHEIISVYDGSTINEDYRSVNNFDGNFSCPSFDYTDTKNFEINYIPGDSEDKYPYIYGDDETRRTVKKIGKGLSFGWALTYANGYLWRFSLGIGEVGESLDFIKINPESGEFERYGNNDIMNPRGLTYDGEYFWVNDFSLLKIFKFKLDRDFIEILDSFDIPEKEKGGTMGLTSDEEFLYLRSRDASKIYKLNKNGNLIDELYFENAGIGNTLVWTGEHFWTAYGCEKGLCKWDKNGKIIGNIYPPAKDIWALAWDGEYLWTIQRTCEMWDDAKIYQINILNDSL